MYYYVVNPNHINNYVDLNTGDESGGDDKDDSTPNEVINLNISLMFQSNPTMNLII